MLIDIKTAFILVGLLYIVLPTVIFYLLKDYTHAPVRLWCFGGLLVGNSMILLAIRAQYESYLPCFVAFTASNALMVLGYLFRIQSLRIELKKPLSPSHIVWILLSFILIFEILRVVLGVALIRMCFAYFSISLLAFWVAISSLEYEKKFGIKQIRLIYSPYFLLSCLLVFRILSLLLGYESANPLGNSLSINLIALVSLITVILSNVVYLGMMLAKPESVGAESNRKNKKLMNELKNQTKIVRDLIRVQAFSVVGTY